MFILPLGLGSRLPSLPMMCILLCLCIAGYSIVSFPVIEKFDKVMSEDKTEPLKKIAGPIYEELCTIRVKNPEMCKGMSAKIAKKFAKDEVKESKNDTVTKPGATADEVTKPALNTASKDSIKDILSDALAMTKLGEEFTRLLQHPEKVTDARVRALPSFPQVLSLHESQTARMDKAAHDLGLLSGSTLSFITLLKAQFTHAGWMHLLSNLAVLVLVGIYVEARAGALWYLAIFLASGILGMMGHLSLSDDPSRIIVGASAGVAGVMGAFLAFFFYQPMKVWVSFLLVYNRVVFIPAYLILGPLFVGHDIVGAFSTDDGVAHIAHLSGLVVGFLLGRLHLKVDPVTEGMLYNDEEFFSGKLAEIPSAEKRIVLARKVLLWNPNNLIALRSLLDDMFKSPDVKETLELNQALTSYLVLTLRQGLRKDALKILQGVPAGLSLASLIVRQNSKARLKLAEFALKNGDWLTAIRVYDSVLFKGVKPDMRHKILENVENLYTHVNSLGTAPDSLKQVRLSSELKERFAA